MSEPGTVERHLFALPPDSARRPESRGLVLARVLEEGDRSELAWLAGEVSRQEITDFVRNHGGRKLSSRSRRFWSRALGIQASAPHPLAEELWPLA